MPGGGPEPQRTPWVDVPEFGLSVRDRALRHVMRPQGCRRQARDRAAHDQSEREHEHCQQNAFFVHAKDPPREVACESALPGTRRRTARDRVPRAWFGLSLPSLLDGETCCRLAVLVPVGTKSCAKP